MRFMVACSEIRQVNAAYYGERIAGKTHLDDLLTSCAHFRNQRVDEPIFVIHWGPDIPNLLARLAGCDVIYVAHSTGWGMALPPQVPILCVSRHTMAYWGRHAPNSYIALMPNIVDVDVLADAPQRDIDVLIQARKSSQYLLHRLAPALQDRCNVTILDGWVDDLRAWFRRSKVYLYDSLEHWADVGASEGFGLPPLEAMGQGCIVFSSVNDALSDYLDPGLNCRKIRVHSLTWDVEAILRAVTDGVPISADMSWFAQYSIEGITSRWQSTLDDLELFFSHTAIAEPDIDDLWAARRPSRLQRTKRAVCVLLDR
ncbi:glycosyltransferase [Novosphingobium gossypii]|uniref:glycosyltransferase n=1 Tax=Novosphingobium gossypii TaxID=1604774 RepID=UPI003D19142B